jgi:signal transduction histidine kinase
MTKEKISDFSARYVTALRKHLKRYGEARAPGSAAFRSGEEAVMLGLDTLGLARIHEEALVTLNLTRGRSALLKWAAQFFFEAHVPILETHRAVQEKLNEVNRLKAALEQSTQELTETHRQLKNCSLRAKNLDASIKQSVVDNNKLLKESLDMQDGLRQLTHRVMVAQEEDRQKVSLELHNEIAQTLLGMNVKLISVKHEAQASNEGLKSEIASTQRLVEKSAKSVRRVARELRNS